ncbi:hypothetical protein B5M09_013749 [Aphanomyces astaci]|uniref:Uncharacterized protein n=1 Tax=Aphanomyces astaci TaxID=112090 RepID=A0A3R7YK70_APHAT|nr:hypothetical protein B5M09_013749 [Aphanomyces astaci]
MNTTGRSPERRPHGWVQCTVVEIGPRCKTGNQTPARTVQPLRLPTTGDICKWDPPALNFYWRAICYTLHANARKHRIQPRWEAHCRTCPDLSETQEHRLTTPTCPKAVPLSQHILLATQAVLPQG